jgi:hypothetical protein
MCRNGYTNVPVRSNCSGENRGAVLAEEMCIPACTHVVVSGHLRLASHGPPSRSYTHGAGLLQTIGVSCQSGYSVDGGLNSVTIDCSSAGVVATQECSNSRGDVHPYLYACGSQWPFLGWPAFGHRLGLTYMVQVCFKFSVFRAKAFTPSTAALTRSRSSAHRQAVSQREAASAREACERAMVAPVFAGLPSASVVQGAARVSCSGSLLGEPTEEAAGFEQRGAVVITPGRNSFSLVPNSKKGVCVHSQ